MIRSRDELKFYLAADKYALGMVGRRPGSKDDVWKYQILLRKVEYYRNVKGRFLSKLLLKFYNRRKHKLGVLLGFDIPSNVFGAGLRINHFGNIIVNGAGTVGMWCDIHQGVNIGTNASSDGSQLVPRIGNNVWIGPGAKLFGEIEIGSHVVIGANAVVGQSFPAGTTIVGIPARIVRDTGTEKLEVAASVERMNAFFKERPEFSCYKSGEFSVL